MGKTPTTTFPAAHITLYIEPHIGATQIQKLRPVRLNELYAKLLREGGKGGRPLSPRTVGHVHWSIARLAAR